MLLALWLLPTHVALKGCVEAVYRPWPVFHVRQNEDKVSVLHLLRDTEGMEQQSCVMTMCHHTCLGRQIEWEPSWPHCG